MGKRKHKEPEDTPRSDAVSTSYGIFETLFGEASEQNLSASLFSDNNPFRRKPREPALVNEAPQDSKTPGNGGSEDCDNGELRRKKKKGAKSKFDSVSGVEASEATLEETEKPKKEEGEARLLVPESHEVSKEKGKKKKRKRDELEREYEARKFGVSEEKEDGVKRLGEKIAGNKRKTVENPATMMVQNEGFDDEEKLLRTIFVGNLPLKVKKKALLKEFSKFGDVESVRIRSVPILDTKKPRKGAILAKKINDTADSVHAYIVFKTEESAQASLSENLALVGGNHIRVDRACPPRKKHKGEAAALYDNKRTIFVGNLPFDVKDEELYQLFCGIPNLGSSIEAVRVIRDPHINLGKGIAYVLFKTMEAANLVLKRRNLKLRDRELRLCHAKSNRTPSKRPNPSPPHASSTPAKKLAGDDQSPSDSKKRKENGKSVMTYQGMRANKSAPKKKLMPQREAVPQKTLMTRRDGVRKELKTKRPAVAARKAKALALKDGFSSKAGMKRKIDSCSPESFKRNKKVKKHR